MNLGQMPSDKDMIKAFLEFSAAVLAVVAPVLSFVLDRRKKRKGKGRWKDFTSLALGVAVIVLAVAGAVLMLGVKRMVIGLCFFGAADLLLIIDYVRPGSRPDCIDTVVLVVELCLLVGLVNLYILMQVWSAQAMFNNAVV